MKGIIFDIKRYAIHDGPGIRSTVFFKGCSLRCEWCHNPEGIESNPEIMVYSNRCAEECFACVSECHQSAILKNGNSVVIDQAKCHLCGSFEQVCVYEALEIVGKEVTVEEVMEDIEKDRIFFDESGGGVTFSGGEPLMQPDFLESILVELRERKIHSTVDTSGYVSFKDLDRISDKVDLYLYDLKLMDEKKHKNYTGKSNKTILENLKKLLDRGISVAVRIPLISGINDDNKNIRMTAEYLHTLKNIKQINLLPYHKGGCEKHKKLVKKRSWKTFQAPSDKRINEIKGILSDYGFSVKIGG